MTLPYDLKVQFDQKDETGDVSGTLTVNVQADCTCRKLLVKAGNYADGGRTWQSFGSNQQVVHLETWEAGKTYHYPFSIQKLDMPPPPWGIAMEVYRTSEFNPDPQQIWPAGKTTLEEKEQQSIEASIESIEVVVEEPTAVTAEKRPLNFTFPPFDLAGLFSKEDSNDKK